MPSSLIRSGSDLTLLVHGCSLSHLKDVKASAAHPGARGPAGGQVQPTSCAVAGMRAGRRGERSFRPLILPGVST